MCSGIEAPIFAMKMVQSIIDRVVPGEGVLDFRHEFACEIMKFKQSYILPNTDGVAYSILYHHNSKTTTYQPDMRQAECLE
ncbi:hypothetical protein GGS26DRAFT_571043 [Hypomontagnella submonticulosa]|nr:hypothetical protein GGS26DRAFT_571043 [Hypomontagnella submonticulosa]